MRCVLGPSFTWDMYILHEAIILMLWTYLVDSWLHAAISHATCHSWLVLQDVYSKLIRENTLPRWGVQTWDLFTVECFNHCHFKANKEAFGSTWDLLGTGKMQVCTLHFGKNAHKLVKYYIEVWVNSYCWYCQNVLSSCITKCTKSLHTHRATLQMFTSTGKEHMGK